MLEYSFDHRINEEEAARFFDNAFAESLTYALASCAMSAEETKKLWSPVPSQALIFGESVYRDQPTQRDQLAAIRDHIEQSGLFEDIAQANEAPFHPNARSAAALALYKTGNYVIGTKSGKTFLFLTYADKAVSPQEYIANTAGLSAGLIQNRCPGLTVLHNIDLASRIPVEAHRRALACITERIPAIANIIAERKKLSDWKKAELATSLLAQMQSRLGKLSSVINTHFINAILDCRVTLGDNVPQIFVDAVTYRAFTKGQGLSALGGMFAGLFEMGSELLREQVAVYQVGMQNAPVAVVATAKLLKMYGENARHLLGQVRPKPEELDPGHAEVVGQLRPADADRPEVKTYLRALKEAENPGILRDPYKVVPHIFDMIDRTLQEPESSVELTNIVYKAVAGRLQGTEYKALVPDEQQDPAKLIVALQMAFCMRYLESVWSLMPEQFPNMAPLRGQNADQRLMDLSLKFRGISAPTSTMQ